jgi:hypothetical protein
VTDTFAGITINVEAVGPGRTQESDTSVRHIPGSSQTYVDLGGLPARTLSYTLFFSTHADFVTMEGHVGTQDTLVSTADGTNTAILLSLKRTERNLSTAGETSATAEFLIT